MATVISDDQAKKRISENVLRLLEAKDWTQKELAEATGESQMRVSLMIRGVNLPSAAFLARIAEALDVTVDDLLGKSRNLSQTA